MAPSTPDDAAPSLIEPAAARYLVSRSRAVPLGSLLTAGPKAARFMVRSAQRNLRYPSQLTHPDIPTRTPSLGMAAGVWLDEVFLAMMASTRLALDESDLDRVAREVDTALAAMDDAGILEDPRLLHPRPAAPTDGHVAERSSRGIRYDHVRFTSRYRPVVELPGHTRWETAIDNRTAHAFVLRHRKPRPWLIQLHGFGMGEPSDLVALRALHYHRDLGFNVAHPVFPLHGERRGDGELEAINLDYLNNVHAVSQAIHDTRALISWLDPDRPVAVHGVSLGGFLAGQLAAVDERIGCVIAGAPPADLAFSIKRHVPSEDRAPLDERGLLGRRADAIHAVISPLTVEPIARPERRYVYAGVADRMSTPGQAHRLWEHWDRGPVLWYRGAHVGFAWSREVRTYVDRTLRSWRQELSPR